MIEKVSLLGRKTYKISDKVTVNIPTVGLTRGENVEDENNFWSEIGLFTISPDDMCVDLENYGIDFTQMSEYSLFTLLFSLQRDEKLSQQTPDLLFSDFSLWELELVQINGKFVLIDSDKEVVIDEEIYNKLSDIISFITGHKKPKRLKFGNKFARKKWVEKEKRKREIAKKKKPKDTGGGVLDGIILRLVCNANFPYNFETVNDVTLFDLLYSLKQIEKDVSVTDLMQSRLVGVDLKKFTDKQLSRYVL